MWEYPLIFHVPFRLLYCHGTASFGTKTSLEMVSQLFQLLSRLFRQVEVYRNTKHFFIPLYKGVFAIFYAISERNLIAFNLFTKNQIRFIHKKPEISGNRANKRDTITIHRRFLHVLSPIFHKKYCFGRCFFENDVVNSV